MNANSYLSISNIIIKTEYEIGTGKNTRYTCLRKNYMVTYIFRNSLDDYNLYLAHIDLDDLKLSIKYIERFSNVSRDYSFEYDVYDSPQAIPWEEWTEEKYKNWVIKNLCTL